MSCLVLFFFFRPPLNIVHLGGSSPNPSSLADIGGGQKSSRQQPGASCHESNGGAVDAMGPLHNVSAAGSVQRPPMPDEEELERRFSEVLVQMDLPPERAKHLRGFDAAKKWDIICDQEQVRAREPPSAYLAKIRTYLDPTASHSTRKIKALGDITSTQVLRDLEISLRTNNIEWVREFLDEENLGLDVLVNYLDGQLLVMRHMLKLEAASDMDESGDKKSARASVKSSVKRGGATGSSSLEHISKLMRRSTKLKMGDATDDIHVCIMCLRAIMNNKFGFNMVIQHKQAINCIALSLVS